MGFGFRGCSPSILVGLQDGWCLELGLRFRVSSPSI
jgi:hypothetical protein